MVGEDVFQQYMLPIGTAYFIAWINHRLAGRVAKRLIGLSGYVPQGMRVRQERQRTLGDLLSSTISFLGFLIASIFTLDLFIDTTALIWAMGLFSAAFGLGARPIISDYLTGVSFIFGDVFDVGEKVEVLGVEGGIEKISLTRITVRSIHGEVFSIPNGEVRVVRNFSRGSFSSADITVKLESADLDKALAVLTELADKTPTLLPEVLEPFKIVNTSGTIGQHVELTLVTKAHFGKAANVRLQLLSVVYEHLTAGDIRLAS